MRTIFLYIATIFFATTGFAQNFIFKGLIEFEVKTNVEKKYAEFRKNDDRGFADQMPAYMTYKKQLIFSDNKMIYRQVASSNMIGFFSGTSVYTDLDQQKTIFGGSLFSDEMIIEDSVKTLRWKILDETRNIAGWKCRKAVGVLLDSIYVVAFYCPEIVPQGGPEFFSGLPGMILGLAIPRTYTTWFATKVQVTGMDEKMMKLIAAPVPGKKEKIHPISEARKKWRESMGSFLKKRPADEEIDLLMKGLSMDYLFRE